MLSEIGCIALAIYFEARSESLYGKLLVANVMSNRVKSKQYPDSYCGVLTQKKQFSFLNKKSPKLRIGNERAWNESYEIAEHVYEHNPTYFEGCHYTQVGINNKWTKVLVKVIIEGDHVFYKGEGCK